MNQAFVQKIGWTASFLAVTMYFSYADQIRLNLSGNPGSLVLPLVTALNCTTWILYATLKEKRDWPLIVCNIPGVILGIITAVTSVYGRTL